MPASIIKDRLNHKVFGPITISYLIFKWDILLAALDLGRPYDQRIKYISENSFYAELLYILPLGLAVAMVLPSITHWYVTTFELPLIEKRDERLALHNKKIDGIKFRTNLMIQNLNEIKTQLDMLKNQVRSTGNSARENAYSKAASCYELINIVLKEFKEDNRD